MSFLFDKYNESFYTTKKLSNGQTIRIDFEEFVYDNFVIYNVALVISTKRKRMNCEALEHLTTGRAGLEGLIWAKQMILAFEDYIRNSLFYRNKKTSIEISWADNRRRDVYVKALKKYGYNVTFDGGYKHLFKRIL